MQLTTPQLQILKNSINSNVDPQFIVYRQNGQNTQMADWYNVSSTFIVFKQTENTFNIGDVISYVAVAALTQANLDKVNTFYNLNPANFEPNRADERQYLADTFSGALGGAGQVTRDALDALYRRPATRGENLYTTGTGTTLVPGELNATAVGSVTDINIQTALSTP